MEDDKVIVEDGVPVNTTANAGQPLGNDQPIKKPNMFRRFRELKDEKLKTVNKE